MKLLPFFTRSLSAVVITVALGACGSSGSDPAPTPTPEPQPSAAPAHLNAQALLDQHVSDDVPGMVLYVQSPEQSHWVSAGVADLKTLEPMPLDARMPIGSAGKSMVAVLALQLQEQGLVDLDAPISDWLDDQLLDRIPHSRSMTLRQLLNHTSGLFDYLHNPDFVTALLAEPDKHWLDDDVLPFALDKPASFAPGERFDYSNSGYVLAGVILNKVLGYHTAEALRQNILTPTAMDNTLYLGAETDEQDIVSGYRDLSELGIGDIGIVTNLKPLLYNLGVSDAPVASTVEDMARYQRALASGNSLISDDSRDQMFGQDSLVALPGVPGYLQGSKLSYGLGLFKEEREGITLYHHGGDQFGWLTHNLIWSERELQLVLMVNCGGDVCEQAASDVVNAVINHFQ